MIYYNTIRCTTTLYDILHHYMICYNIIWYATTLYDILQDYMIYYNIVCYSTTLYAILQHYVVYYKIIEALIWSQNLSYCKKEQHITMSWILSRLPRHNYLLLCAYWNMIRETVYFKRSWRCRILDTTVINWWAREWSS